MQDNLISAVRTHLDRIEVKVRNLIVGDNWYYIGDCVVARVSPKEGDDIITRIDQRDGVLVLVKTYYTDNAVTKATVVRPSLEKIVGKVLEAFTEMTADQRSVEIPKIVKIFEAMSQPFGLQLSYAKSFCAGYIEAAQNGIRSCMEGDNVDFYGGSSAYRLVMIRDKEGALIGRALIVHPSAEPTLSDRTSENDPVNDKTEEGWKWVRVYVKGEFTSRQYDMVIGELALLCPNIKQLDGGWVVSRLPENRFLPYLDACGTYYAHDASEVGDAVYVSYNRGSPYQAPNDRTMRSFSGQSTEGNKFYEDSRCTCYDCGSYMDDEEGAIVNDELVCPDCLDSGYTYDIFGAYVTNDDALAIVGGHHDGEYIDSNSLPRRIAGVEYVLATRGFNGESVAAPEDECRTLDGEVLYGVSDDDIQDVRVFAWDFYAKYWKFTGVTKTIRKVEAHNRPANVMRFDDGEVVLLSEVQEHNASGTQGFNVVRMTEDKIILRNAEEQELRMRRSYSGYAELLVYTPSTGSAQLAFPYWSSLTCAESRDIRYNMATLCLCSTEVENMYNVAQSNFLCMTKPAADGYGSVLYIDDPYMTVSLIAMGSVGYRNRSVISNALCVLCDNGISPIVVNRVYIDITTPRYVYLITEAHSRLIRRVNVDNNEIVEMRMSEAPAAIGNL